MRQATLKQVQLVEKIEASSSVKYTGTRWAFDEVSSFLDANIKKKEKETDNTKQSIQKHQITDKQKQFIKVIENKTGICFMGKTFEEAKDYIEKNRNK